MSDRDTFASAALTGILANDTLFAELAKRVNEMGTYEPFALFAFKVADAMVAESNRTRRVDEMVAL